MKIPSCVFLILAILLISISGLTAVNLYNNQKSEIPLVASIIQTDLMPDSTGVNHFVVSGIIENRANKTHDVPNLLVVTYNEKGEQIGDGEEFAPPVSSLNSGVRARFMYTLRAPSIGVKTIVVKLKK